MFSLILNTKVKINSQTSMAILFSVAFKNSKQFKTVIRSATGVKFYRLLCTYRIVGPECITKLLRAVFGTVYGVQLVLL